jgi:uroporphyrinogen-III synthase
LSRAVRVLVTRPEEDAPRTSVALRAAGHEPVEFPLFRITPTSHTVPEGPWDAVMVTSANALRCLAGEAMRAIACLPCLTVGTQTATAASAKGFRHVESAEGDAAALAALADLRWPQGGRFLWLCGEERRDISLAHGVAEPLVTYRAEAVHTLPDGLASRLRSGDIDAVLHFSPRATVVFIDLVEKSGLFDETRRLLHVFISAQAADARFPKSRIVAKPTLDAMIDAI